MRLAGARLDVFAFEFEGDPTTGLETRMTAFLEASPATESLDDKAFAKVNGFGTKADYLLGDRQVVAELKTLNGDPTDRMERRLQARLAEPGAPLGYGRVGVQQIVRKLDDGPDLAKALHDVSTRAVRNTVEKSTNQIAAIKSRLNLPDAAGLTILMNENEPVIDAVGIGYALGRLFETVPGIYPDVDFAWVSIECHKVRMAQGRLGYPQLLISRPNAKHDQIRFIVSTIAEWAKFNGSNLAHLPHAGEWAVLRPIYKCEAPSLRGY